MEETGAGSRHSSNPGRIGRAIAPRWERYSYNEFLLRFNVDTYELTVFPDARAIIKGTDDEQDRTFCICTLYWDVRNISMNEHILVCVAWPYAKSSTHVGQIVGAYLPADTFARYHRMAGNKVLMVSGSDEHGTPILVDAEREGITPREFVARYHQQICEVWDRLGISWDLYTETAPKITIVSRKISFSHFTIKATSSKIRC